jgi:uncharacterized LabA/DUF88 family protein
LISSIFFILDFTMRIALFFDGNNFYRAKDAYLEGIELNYDILAKWVCAQVGGAEAEFVGAFYYTGVAEHTNINRVLDGLELRTGFFVRRAPIVERTLHCVGCGHTHTIATEKRVDTQLVAEMVQMAALDHFDKAILFSGDEDIVPAVEAVSSFGKQVYVATWGGRSLSSELRTRCFGAIDLVEGIDKFYTGRRRCTATGTPLEHLFSQVQEAWSYFQDRNGHVSRWYFENKWKPSGPCPPPGTGRQELLDALIERGSVEVFEITVNGRTVLALRPKRKADA